MFDEYYFDSYDGCSYQYKKPSLDCHTTNKKQTIKVDLHYSDPTARTERTVFGNKQDGLHYNYNDRLEQWDYSKWRKGLDLAKEKADYKTAEYYELALKYFHDSDDLDLKHIILGCNMSNGYPYLVFGYTYTSKTEG